MKPTLAFYMGYSESLMVQTIILKMFLEVKLYQISQSLVDIYDVYIFVNIDSSDEIIHNQVHYLNYIKYLISKV